MAAGRGDPQRVGFGSGSRLVFGYVCTLKNGRVGLHPPNEIVFGHVFTLKNGWAVFCGPRFHDQNWAGRVSSSE